jgi:hypothetical protein
VAQPFEGERLPEQLLHRHPIDQVPSEPNIFNVDVVEKQPAPALVGPAVRPAEGILPPAANTFDLAADNMDEKRRVIAQIFRAKLPDPIEYGDFELVADRHCRMARKKKGRTLGPAPLRIQVRFWPQRAPPAVAFSISRAFLLLALRNGASDRAPGVVAETLHHAAGARPG